MNVWFTFGLLVVMGIVHAVLGSIVVSGICTIASIFILVLDAMKEEIIKVIKQTNKQDK